MDKINGYELLDSGSNPDGRTILPPKGAKIKGLHKSLKWLYYIHNKRGRNGFDGVELEGRVQVT